MKVVKNTKKSNKNVLYTGYGDKGTTTLFHCDQGRISKSASIIEALGSLDELNAYIGIVKVYSEIEKIKLKIGKKDLYFSSILLDIQQNIFVIQAEVGGSDMSIQKSEVNKIEKIIASISEVLPPIRSFTISGGSILSAELDIARTLARKGERRIVGILDENVRKINKNTISYMNRLSSILFAMSRYSNYILSIKEEHPNYNKK
jgi:cob(I)alamin adenosyltransferase